MDFDNFENKWLTEQIQDTKNGEIAMLNIDDLLPFRTGTNGHIYEIREDGDYIRLKNNISEVGKILEPIIVRRDKTFNDRYEILSGHRRTKIAKELNFLTVPATIIDCDDEDAIMTMAITNEPRENLKPSERGMAYRVFYEANLAKNNEKKVGNTRKETSNIFGISESSVQLYMRLTFLNKELLDYVDNGKINVKTGANISYMGDDEQLKVLDYVKRNGTITLEEVNYLKQIGSFEKDEDIEDIISDNLKENKPIKKVIENKIKGKSTLQVDKIKDENTKNINLGSIKNLLEAADKDKSEKEIYQVIKRALEIHYLLKDLIFNYDNIEDKRIMDILSEALQ